MGIEIPECLLNRLNGSRIGVEEWAPIMGCPMPDGSAATDSILRQNLLLFEERYNLLRRERDDPVTTTTNVALELVIHTDLEAMKVNDRLGEHGKRKLYKAARQYAAINRRNLTHEQRQEHSKGLEKIGRFVAALRRASRQRPTVTPTVSRVPKLGHQPHVVREVFDHA